MAGSLSHEFREAAGELRKFVPVRVVSCIEGCLKAGTARLIITAIPVPRNTQYRRELSIVSQHPLGHHLHQAGGR